MISFSGAIKMGFYTSWASFVQNSVDFFKYKSKNIVYLIFKILTQLVFAIPNVLFSFCSYLISFVIYFFLTFSDFFLKPLVIPSFVFNIIFSIWNIVLTLVLILFNIPDFVLKCRNGIEE